MKQVKRGPGRPKKNATESTSEKPTYYTHKIVSTILESNLSVDKQLALTKIVIAAFN